MLPQKRSRLIFYHLDLITTCDGRFTAVTGASVKERKIDILLAQLESGDTLIVSDMSRLGWSVTEIIRTVNTLIKHRICVVAVKEGINLKPEAPNWQSQVMIEMFQLFYYIQRELVSQRTTEALTVRRALGRNGGRPRTDPKKLEQARILYDKSNQTAAEVCQAVGVGRRTFFRYLSERKQKLAATTDESSD
jgi:DNA invertase Pin-like site-specific DNA recombinase